MKSIIISTFIFSVMACADTNESLIVPDNPIDLNSNSASFNDEDCAEVDSVAFILGYAMGEYVDELAKDGLDSFFIRDSILKGMVTDWFNQSNDTLIPLDTIIEYIHVVHSADEDIVKNYFMVILDHSEYLIDTMRYEELISAGFCYASNYNPGFQTRGWASYLLSSITGESGPCTFAGLYGRVIDAAVDTVGFMSGIGSVKKIRNILSGGWNAFALYDLYHYALTEC